MNDCLFTFEGTSLVFTVTADDPNGDEVVLACENKPAWGGFDTVTGVFTGSVPWWSTNAAIRDTQEGLYDLCFTATAGGQTVTNIVTLHACATNWTPATMAELVAARPVTGNSTVGTPVSNIIIRTDTIVPSAFGGGKNLRRIEFSFTSQAPDVSGWENDWLSITNVAYLPEVPAATNCGGVIEGLYAGSFGETQFAERVCAELDLPMLIPDLGWTNGHGIALMTKYDDEAVATGDPRFLFYVFSAAHYLRCADALVTLIDTQTAWPVAYSNFQVVFTGHSKFGHTCSKAAAADPARVAGYMANGCPDIDTGACRLLGDLQGALATKPDAGEHYLGVMMRRYVETLDLMGQMTANVRALFTLGTDDDRNCTTGYTPKYVLGISERQMSSRHKIGGIPNMQHTTHTTWHFDYWRMWVAHCLLGRPVTSIDSTACVPVASQYEIRASLSGLPAVQSVGVWATGENDRDISNWTNFALYPMALSNELWVARIPDTCTAFFVALTDASMGVTGMITTATWPTDPDYPLLSQSPDPVSAPVVTQDITGVDLNWLNPESPDCAGIIVRYSTTGFSDDPTEGTLIFDGTGTFCTHDDPSRDVVSYYTIFTYDDQGNYGNSFTVRVDRAEVLPRIDYSSCTGGIVSLSLANLTMDMDTCVERTTNLTTDSWTEQDRFLPPSTSTNWSEPENGDPNAFYRLRVEW